MTSRSSKSQPFGPHCRFAPPTTESKTVPAMYRRNPSRAVVSARGAFMSGAFYFAVYIGTGLVIVVLIAWLIDYFT